MRTDDFGTPLPRPVSTGALVRHAVLGLLLLSLGVPIAAQAQQPVARPAAGGTAAATKAPASSRPSWSELTPAQQQSLAPLSAHWNALHPAQKRKWIALSRNFGSMSAEDQKVLHSRMTEWASLSAQERTKARLNFATVKRLAPEDERKAKWEAYQALSDEEKRKLAEQAGTRPPSAAAPVRPVAAQKFAPVPSVSNKNQYPPRIQLAPPASAAAVPPVAAAPVPAAPAVPSPPAISAPAASVAPPAPAASSTAIAPPAPALSATTAAPASAPAILRPQEAP